MRRFLPAVATIVLAPTLLGQTSAPSPAHTEEHPETLCVIAGRVVTAAEGIPLGSARIALMPEESRPDAQI
jgi:hypothetical protein